VEEVRNDVPTRIERRLQPQPQQAVAQ